MVSLIILESFPYSRITQTFELLTGCCLFCPKAGQKLRLDDDHLAMMMGLTKET